MGSAVSAITGSTGKSFGEPVHPLDREDDEDSRPAKRRKTSTFEPPNTGARFPSESPRRKPFGHVTNESRRAQARLAGKLQAVQPSAFYGKPRSETQNVAGNTTIERSAWENDQTSTQRIDNLLLVEPHINFKRGLQIEVLAIETKSENFHETIGFLNGNGSPVDVKCRCTVSLLYRHDDDSTSQLASTEVIRKSKTCILRTTVADDDSITRQIICPEPFFITGEEMFVNRRIRGSLGTVFLSSELAEKYLVMVALDPIGLQPHWPPFDLQSDDANAFLEQLNEQELSKYETSLNCTMSRQDNMLDPKYQNKKFALRLTDGENLKLKLPLVLKLQMKWSLPSKMSELPTRKENSTPKQSMSSNDLLEDTIPPSPLAVQGDDNSAANSPANARAHRRRSNIPTTYNLKALSTIAQGRSPKVRKSFRSKGQDSDDSGFTVTYCMGRADATDYGTRLQTKVNGLICPFCSLDQNSLDELRVHLHSEHTSFKFTFRAANPHQPKFFVELVKHGARSTADDTERIFQLGKPQTLFDLEKYLNGDDSWAKSREGPLHNIWPDHLIEKYHDSSSSPSDSRHSSPNTSIDNDGMMDYEIYKLPVRSRKVYYVPKTSKPLYHSITKQILKPGDEIPSSDDEKDEGWLHQKHRDIIMDITDVTPDEKDYLHKWNPYIMDIQLTSDKFLPEAVHRFAEENKGWFTERKSRKVEFFKHMETFVMRGVMTQALFSRVVDTLRKAEKAAENDVDMDAEKKPISPAKQRGLLDCICGDHTQPPDRVICRGRNCKGRYFHRKCAEESGRPIQGTWFCEHCIS